MPATINGRYYSFASSETTLIRADGTSAIVLDISSASYSDNLEMSDVPGAAQVPVGVTSGVYKAENSKFTVSKESFNREIVEAHGDNGWMGKKITVAMSFADESNPISTDTVIGFLVGASDDRSAGPENLNVELTVKTSVILRNGKAPLGASKHLL